MIKKNNLNLPHLLVLAAIGTLICLSSYTMAQTASQTNPQPFVIPALREWHGGKGEYLLKSSSRIVLSKGKKEALEKAASILKDDIHAQTGYNLKIVSKSPKKGDIVLSLGDTDTSIGEEGYNFKASEYLSISANNYKGLFYGTRTLLQLLEHKKSIPQGSAKDFPEFKVRSFVLDVGRKFFSISFLQDYVKLMSYYKFNDFQIHLNDNGFKKYFDENWDKTYSAFRLENETYPGLTAKDGSYTKKEFIALQALAKDYALTIIPEIDAPAHALAFTKVKPELGSKAYGMDHLDLKHPGSLEMMKNVFKEYLSGDQPVFTGTEVHIGTDEYDKKEAELFRAFTDQMIEHVQSYGKTVRIWGALTHAAGKTPVRVKNVNINAWYNGYADPIEMKKLGYKQISTPDGWLYIVPAAGYYYDYLNYKNIYDKWSPLQVGNVRFAAGDSTIIGGAFAAWNDIVGNGISEKDVNDRVFPAMQVLSQKMWGGDKTIMTYETFDAERKNIGEGPSINIRGKIGRTSQSPVVAYTFDKRNKNIQVSQASYANGKKGKALSFTGSNSFAKLPYKEIGYDYTVSFWINPSDNPGGNITLFKSSHSEVKLKQGNNGKLGFSRDGYHYDFDYTVPEKTWTHITISGTAKGTNLYINGRLQKSLKDNWIQYTDKDKTKMRKVETLFFPLEQIGGFNGMIDDLQVWNRLLSDEEILTL
ncbi:family 20 glycosylhydrolase [Pedobacter sp.]|uniref:family 20 glycosylhydrolase n=1 Tax=Pedobacter sp. TaxID=1411316 RepID=UPI003D7FE9C1